MLTPHLPFILLTQLSPWQAIHYHPVFFQVPGPDFTSDTPNSVYGFIFYCGNETPWPEAAYKWKVWFGFTVPENKSPSWWAGKAANVRHGSRRNWTLTSQPQALNKERELNGLKSFPVKAPPSAGLHHLTLRKQHLQLTSKCSNAQGYRKYLIQTTTLRPTGRAHSSPYQPAHSARQLLVHPLHLPLLRSIPTVTRTGELGQPYLLFYQPEDT